MADSDSTACSPSSQINIEETISIADEAIRPILFLFPRIRRTSRSRRGTSVRSDSAGHKEEWSCLIPVALASQRRSADHIAIFRTEKAMGGTKARCCSGAAELRAGRCDAAYPNESVVLRIRSAHFWLLRTLGGVQWYPAAHRVVNCTFEHFKNSPVPRRSTFIYKGLSLPGLW
jgi:hypothetical protein